MSTTPEWLSLLRIHTDRFADLISDADLDVPLTFCPGWALRDLAVHLGGVHQWAAHAVLTGNPTFQPEIDERADPAQSYRQHAAHLIEVLSQTPADAPAWTLDKTDPTAGFWWRRQVHETVIHVWDAEEALGDPHPIEPWLAWDGVLEVADVIYPRQVRLGRLEPLPHGVRLVATDGPGDVTFGVGEPLVVRDRAEVLLRLLWHRVDPDEGVEPGVTALLSAAVTP